MILKRTSSQIQGHKIRLSVSFADLASILQQKINHLYSYKSYIYSSTLGSLLCKECLKHHEILTKTCKPETDILNYCLNIFSRSKFDLGTAALQIRLHYSTAVVGLVWRRSVNIMYDDLLAVNMKNKVITFALQSRDCKPLYEKTKLHKIRKITVFSAKKK